jgi:beta-lactamase superfamily II metal-dependent hydrolase
VKLTVFPASDGDCLLLSYSSAPERHILIDGGRKRAYAALSSRLRDIARDGERLEALLLTHIDADHIEGLLAMIEDRDYIPIAEVWFNGYEQLATVKAQGPGQADRFSAALKRRQLAINSRFGHSAIVVPGGHGLPPSVELEDGLKITFLSPDKRRLDDLQRSWQTWRDKDAREAEQPARAGVAGLEAFGRSPMPDPIDVEKLASRTEQIDDEIPNGSSIAFVVEFDSQRVLFGADAHPDLVLANIERMKSNIPGFRIDVYKVSHHGSTTNTTRALIEALDCARFVISSDGSRHGHPDPASIAKMIKHGKAGPKVLHFNYSSDRTMPWHNQALRRQWDYNCQFPAANGAPLEIEI